MSELDGPNPEARSARLGPAGESERLVSLLPVLLCISSTDGYFKWVNAEFSRVLGWSEHELLTIPYLDLVHPDDIAATTGAVEMQTDGTPARLFENRYRCKDGSYRWLSWESNPVEVAGLMYAVARDVTEQRRIQEELVVARDAANRANQAKNDFLSRMSHELRTPLNVVLGFSQLLEMDDLSDEQREAVEHIIKAGRHLLSLIDEVLDISRIDSRRLALSIESVVLKDVVDDVVQLMAPLAAAAGVQLPHHHYDSAIHVAADRQRLKQVLLNLVSNAIKYNRPNGSVAIQWEGAADDSIAIVVSDSGRGIRPEAMERLFDAFDRLGAEATGIEGTGLGLALSKSLTEAMGGTLSAESALGEGSRFRVTLPSAASSATRLAADLPGIQGEPPKIFGARRVLYIEDNVANLTLLRKLFATRPSVELISAMQGRLGLDLARQHRPDLVILDLHLPDMHGHEVLTTLKSDASLRDIPVVVASADATHGQVERLLAAGALRYLTKPLNMSELLAVVDGIFTPAA